MLPWDVHSWWHHATTYNFSKTQETRDSSLALLAGSSASRSICFLCCHHPCVCP